MIRIIQFRLFSQALVSPFSCSQQFFCFSPFKSWLSPTSSESFLVAPWSPRSKGAPWSRALVFSLHTTWANFKVKLPNAHVRWHIVLLAKSLVITSRLPSSKFSCNSTCGVLLKQHKEIPWMVVEFSRQAFNWISFFHQNDLIVIDFCLHHNINSPSKTENLSLTLFKRLNQKCKW